MNDSAKKEEVEGKVRQGDQSRRKSKRGKPSRVLHPGRKQKLKDSSQAAPEEFGDTTAKPAF